MASRILRYDNVRAKDELRTFFLLPDSLENGAEILKEWSQLGLYPTREDEAAKFITKMQKQQSAVVTEAALNAPHPYRIMDYMSLPFSTSIHYRDGALALMSAIKAGYPLDSLEIMLMIWERDNTFPQFTEVANMLGLGAFFLNLCPLIFNIQKAPMFTFESSACNEVRAFDIQSGVDTSFVQTPSPFSYFHIEDAGGLTLHDPVSGYHELDGFYMSENTDTWFTHSPQLLAALGLDSSKPYRVITFCFTGKPIDTIANDTLVKYDFYLQDGLEIGELLERYCAWHTGKLAFAEKRDEGYVHTQDNKMLNSDEIDNEHNLELLRHAINYLCYLNFAEFRKREIKHRSIALDGIMKKSERKRRKEGKNLAGKSDSIVISSTNNVFSGSGASGAGGYKVTPHFRRGFLRNQRYGSGDNVHHRPKYIAPTIVGQHEGDDTPVRPKPYKVK